MTSTPGHTNEDISVIAKVTAASLDSLDVKLDLPLKDTYCVAIVGDLFESEFDEGSWQEYSHDKELQQKHRKRIQVLADVIVPGHGPPFAVTK